MKTITNANTEINENAKSVEFSTRGYEVSHGKAPSGRGSWAFCPVRKESAANYLDFTVMTVGGMLLKDAKKIAANHFAALGEGYIAIMP